MLACSGPPGAGLVAPQECNMLHAPFRPPVTWPLCQGGSKEMASPSPCQLRISLAALLGQLSSHYALQEQHKKAGMNAEDLAHYFGNESRGRTVLPQTYSCFRSGGEGALLVFFLFCRRMQETTRWKNDLLITCREKLEHKRTSKINSFNPLLMGVVMTLAKRHWFYWAHLCNR